MEWNGNPITWTYHESKQVTRKWMLNQLVAVFYIVIVSWSIFDNPHKHHCLLVKVIFIWWDGRLGLPRTSPQLAMKTYSIYSPTRAARYGKPPYIYIYISEINMRIYKYICVYINIYVVCNTHTYVCIYIYIHPCKNTLNTIYLYI